MFDTKFFIGPMSKNVVDTIIDFCNEKNYKMGFIASRRQIENTGGYVNNWNTNEFCEYVRKKTSNLIIERDHSGPEQGYKSDDGYDSLSYDSNYFDIIHIDPWKKYSDFQLGVDETIRMINFCYNINPDIKFEVGTEESIRKFEATDLSKMMNQLKNKLKPKTYEQIKFLVIQSGTSLKETNQTGLYNTNRLKEMLQVCKDFKILSKEHNGDYLSVNTIEEKFKLGLNSINIAPEFGLIETLTYIEEIKDEQIIYDWWKICIDSNRWQKWVDKNFNPEENKIQLIKICGHYTFSDVSFIKNVKNKIKNIDIKIKKNINDKLNKLYECETKNNTL